MDWMLLLLAGVFETGWAIGLKYTHGFTRLWPTVWTAVAMVISLALLGLATRTLSIGTAYAVWTGIGAAGAGILGMVLLGEPVTVGRIGSIGLIRRRGRAADWRVVSATGRAQRGIVLALRRW